MQRLNIFTVWLIGISLFTPGPTWASWAQVDNATSDVLLKQLTDEGSDAFLAGAIGIQEAMRTLDSGKFREASSRGANAADDFGRARKKFEEARDRVRKSKETADELGKFLRSVNYKAKFNGLSLSEPETSTLWRAVREPGGKGSADQLFEMAAQRAGLLQDQSTKFFIGLTKETYVPSKAATILAELGQDLTFGSYVSAVFAK